MGSQLALETQVFHSDVLKQTSRDAAPEKSAVTNASLANDAARERWEAARRAGFEMDGFYRRRPTMREPTTAAIKPTTISAEISGW